MLGSLLTFFAVGLATILVASVVLSLVGVVFSLTLGAKSRGSHGCPGGIAVW